MLCEPEPVRVVALCIVGNPKNVICEKPKINSWAYRPGTGSHVSVVDPSGNGKRRAGERP